MAKFLSSDINKNVSTTFGEMFLHAVRNKMNIIMGTFLRNLPTEFQTSHDGISHKFKLSYTYDLK